MPSKHYQRVRVMMEAFGQQCPIHPITPTTNTLKLRRKLIDEEKEEVEQEIINMICEYEQGRKPSIWPLVKELCDLLVVTTGTLVALGVDDEWATQYVDLNNLLKVGRPKDADGKVIKAKDHPKVDFTNPLPQLPGGDISHLF